MTKATHNTPRVVMLMLSILMITMQSCVTTRITNNPPNTDCPAGGKRLCHRETHWIYFWGLGNNKEFIAKCKDGNIATVEIKHNYGYTAITFLTLGIVTPQTLEWNCGIKEPCPEAPL